MAYMALPPPFPNTIKDYFVQKLSGLKGVGVGVGSRDKNLNCIHIKSKYKNWLLHCLDSSEARSDDFISGEGEFTT